MNKASFGSEDFEKAYTFKSYNELIESLLEENKTTGTNQSEAMINYTQMNQKRMKRWFKTLKLSDEIKGLNIDGQNQKWLIITEGWCGDAAHNIPGIEMIARELGIETRYILRDENPEIIDAYLTNGGRSIPKLIAVDKDFNELFTWGPRPKECQELYLSLKENGSDWNEILEKVQRWYNSNKGAMLQQEFTQLLKTV
ncbi:thioredoxin family protein [Salibacter halophilus]|uniref:Thioredoxin family protein n=1 Tax=Salibacter halophilus TaxID=1803916 RepID=A0A6N6M3U6_9FLAO|nr:thioredoxin family protein [Salibacter halophilus]KAB1063960.1 thioredoxin family protein [Salibacter halophilus]